MIIKSLATPIKIKYKALPKLPTVSWPIVDVNLSYKREILPQPVLSLVDSGANSSIIHIEIAQALGFSAKKLGRPQKGLSVSGFYESWMMPEFITADIYGYSFAFQFIVINNKDLIWPCILGENTIFEVAKLDFQRFKSFFEIRFREDIN